MTNSIEQAEIDKCRDAFEKWAIAEALDVSRFEIAWETYKNEETQLLWTGWQARATTTGQDVPFVLKPEGQRTKAEEWEAAYRELFNQLNPVMEENARMKSQPVVLEQEVSQDTIDTLCKELDEADTVGKSHTVAMKALRLLRPTTQAAGGDAAVTALRDLVNDLEQRAKWDHSEEMKVVVCGNGVYTRAKATLAAIQQGGSHES